jgi:hypothetical protein
MKDPAFGGVLYMPVTWVILKPSDPKFLEAGFKTREDAESRVAELEAEDSALVGAFRIEGRPPPAIRAAAGEGPT